MALHLAMLALATVLEPQGPYLQVTAKDSSLADSPVLAAAVSRALVVTCATVVVGPRSRAQCGARCVRLTVRQEQPGRFHLEARQLSHVATAILEIPAAASQFEQARAIAVQARLLINWPQPEGELSPALAASAPEQGQPQGQLQAQADGRGVQPGPAVRRPVVPAEAAPPASPALPEAIARKPDTLALDVATTVLGSRDTSFLTWGILLGGRLAIGETFELQLSMAFLDDSRGKDALGKFRQRPRPVSAILNAALPGLPNLRVGLGAELLSIVVDRWGRDQKDSETEWSPGGVARVEYRRFLGRFSFTGSIHAALHPLEARAGMGGAQLLAYPSWTFGASMGLGFGIL